MSTYSILGQDVTWNKIVQGIGGLVVEYSPATRVTRVQFPVDAQFFFLFLCILQKSKRLKKNK